MEERGLAWYALRRTITPWFADRNIKELVEFCKENSVDEIIAKVDTEEFTHGIPTVEWLDGYMPILKKLKSEIENIGVVFSINPWVTTDHCDRGRDIRKIHPDVDMMVGHDGSQCLACACPLSTGWRDLTTKLWSRYASLEPGVLWIEDDIRLLNHRPAEYACFCDLHIKAFSEKVGKKVTREELMAAMLAPGDPHPYRKEWLDLNRDLMIEVAQFFEKIVHGVSPETKVGLMTSLPNHHSLEGRDWKAFTSALGGNKTLVVRPCMCNYSEWTLRGLYDSEWTLRQTLHCLSPGMIIQTEVENVPFSTYSKSTTFTFLQMAISVALGSNGVTMNLFDHMGTPMSVTPEFGPMLKSKKPFLNALQGRCLGAKSAGIRLLHAEKGAYFTKAPESADWRDILPEGQSWRKILGPFGIPYTYEESSATAISGQLIRAYSDTEIKKLLSSGILLDITAAQCLIEMGYGEYIGIDIKRTFSRNDEPLAAEEYYNEAFGGEERKYITLTLPDLGSNIQLAEIVVSDKAQVISSMVDLDAVRVYPFVTAFENSLGGRVVVYPIDIEKDYGIPLLHPFRKEQMEHIFNWLSKGNVPMVVKGDGVYPLSFRNDTEDYTVAGLFNLSLDAWPSVNIDVLSNGRNLAGIEVLTDNAEWISVPASAYSETDGVVKINWKETLPAVGLIVFTLNWDKK